MLKTIRHLLSLIRFSHTLFALPFALLAALMAWQLSWSYEIVTYPYPRSGDRVHVSRATLFGDLNFSSTKAIASNGVKFHHSRNPWVDYGLIGKQFLGILLCMIFARSAAMAFNRIVARAVNRHCRTNGSFKHVYSHLHTYTLTHTHTHTLY